VKAAIRCTIRECGPHLLRRPSSQHRYNAQGDMLPTNAMDQETHDARRNAGKT